MGTVVLTPAASIALLALVFGAGLVVGAWAYWMRTNYRN
jgi:hypothetical protein